MLSHLVYWKNYWKPDLFFWDENYHVASAAKYLSGTFFMEPHPPLGKMLLALGEKWVAVNSGQTFEFEKFDIIPHEKKSESFSFAGYRFFPAMFAIANILIFGAIAFWITQSYLFAAALAALPLLDSALILHSRGAMLDSFLLFGHLLCIFSFLILLKIRKEEKEKLYLATFFMGFAFAFAAMTKVFALALLVLWPLLFYYRPDLQGFFKKSFLFNFLFVLIFSLALWILHIELGKKVELSLVNSGTYISSSDYERWLLGLEADSWKHMPQKLYEHLRYMFVFQENVSALNFEEPIITGSYPIDWPFGSRPIPYRWQKLDGIHRYLYLIPNPWAWGFGLAALLLALALWIRRGKKFLSSQPEMVSLLLLYFAYILPMCFINRVLYLYHYFPMLFITWILIALLIRIACQELNAVSNRRFQMGLCALPLLVLLGFYSNRGFVYYSATDCRQLKAKYFPPFWGIKLNSCLYEETNKKMAKKFKNFDP